VDSIYLDYNATTPVASVVAAAVADTDRDGWANPSSPHSHGRRAKEILELARKDVASLLGCEAEEIVLTSGGSESDNLAVIGAAEARRQRGMHLVTTAVEHPAIDRACMRLEQRGWAVTRVGVDSCGAVSPARIEQAVRDDTVLVSVIHAQNETGVLEPIAEIGRRLRGSGVLLHTDAAQTVGRIPVSVAELGVDLLTVAGHKFYGPKGTGALYVRRGVGLVPLIHGASHEDGRRAGTENVPGAAGLAAACRLALAELPRRIERLTTLRDRLQRALRDAEPGLIVHGEGAERIPSTISCAFPGIDASELLRHVPEVSASAGSACHSGSREPSSVILAMGRSAAEALSTIRLSVGDPTREEDVDRAATLLISAARRCRRS
jgi:cysteine desulfurase